MHVTASEILPSIIAQWPTLSGLAILAILFWKIFGKFIDESKSLLEASKSLSEQRVSEVNRLRVLIEGLEKDRQSSFDSYLKLREDFAKLSLENASLKRLIGTLEEMVRANGGDIKVIAKRIEENSAELQNISESILMLPPSQL